MATITPGTSATCRSRAEGAPVPPFFQQGGDGSPLDQFIGDLTPDEERYTFDALLTYEITESARVFADLKYSRTKAFSASEPTFDFFLFLEPDYAYTPPNIAAAAANTLCEIDGFVCSVLRDNFDLACAERTSLATRERVVGVDGVSVRARATKSRSCMARPRSTTCRRTTGSTIALPPHSMRSSTRPPARSSVARTSIRRRCRSTCRGTAGMDTSRAGNLGRLVHARPQQRLRAGQHPRHECGVAAKRRPGS